MLAIRKATWKDARILSELNVHVQKIHADAYPRLFKQPANETFAVQFMKQRLLDSSNLFYIANLHGIDIGYIYARIIERPENPLMYSWKTVYIEHISISGQYQRMGYGQRLLEKIYQLARENGIETIALDIWAFNKQSQSFFIKQGFDQYNQKLWKTI